MHLLNWRAGLIQRLIKIYGAYRRWPYRCLQTPVMTGSFGIVSNWSFICRGSGMVLVAITHAQHTVWYSSPATYHDSIQTWGFDLTHAAPNDSFSEWKTRPHRPHSTVDFLVNQYVSVPCRPKQHIWSKHNIFGMHCKLCKNYNRLLRKNGEKSNK